MYLPELLVKQVETSFLWAFPFVVLMLCLAQLLFSQLSGSYHFGICQFSGSCLHLIQPIAVSRLSTGTFVVLASSDVLALIAGALLSVPHYPSHCSLCVGPGILHQVQVFVHS